MFVESGNVEFFQQLNPNSLISGLLVVLSTILLIHSIQITAERTVGDYLKPSDKLRLQRVFTEGLQSTDLQNVYYSAIGIDSLAANTKTQLCQKLSSFFEQSKLSVSELLKLNMKKIQYKLQQQFTPHF